jgi:hypothetical protein
MNEDYLPVVLLVHSTFKRKKYNKIIKRYEKNKRDTKKTQEI